MKNTAFILFSAFLLIALASFASADAFNIPNTGSFSLYQQQPTLYQYNPTVNSNYASVNDGSSNFNYNYQGPLAEKTTQYNQFLEVRPSGKVIQTISSSTTEKYAGEQIAQNSQSQYKNDVNQNYQSAAPLISVNGGNTFLWRQAPSFSSFDYQTNSFGSPYYYQPSYDPSLGYYNWRY